MSTRSRNLITGLVVLVAIGAFMWMLLKFTGRFAPVEAAFTAGWRTWAGGLTLPGAADGLSQAVSEAIRQSAAVLRTHEDRMVPGAIVIVPVYRLYRNFHLLNSLPALGFVQAAFALPICTWILKNAFDAVPGEVMEAALIGCANIHARAHAYSL